MVRSVASITPSKRPARSVVVGVLPESTDVVISVEKPPFGGGRWTHVLFTFERFNTGKADGVVRLYLDGAARGARVHGALEGEPLAVGQQADPEGRELPVRQELLEDR